MDARDVIATAIATYRCSEGDPWEMAYGRREADIVLERLKREGYRVVKLDRAIPQRGVSTPLYRIVEEAK